MRYKNPSRYLTKTHSGFTLIELLVVISIAAIIMAIAVPSFNQLVGQQRVKAAANDFKSAVALARSEARKTGLNTSIRQIGKTSKTPKTPNTADTDQSWEKMSDGWHVYNKPNGSTGTVDISLVRPLDASSIKLDGDNKGLVLAGKTGRINEDESKEICFEDANNNSDVSAYTVYVNKAGSATVKESASCST
jgi:prepilin-type N-terminal cleavage/methylation domain-containing protein